MGTGTGARRGCALVAFLEVGDLVTEDFSVDGDQGKALHLRLGNENAVEGVAMKRGQGAGPLGVLQSNGQMRESVTVNGGDDGLREGQLAGGAFHGDFPDRCGADEDLVGGVGYLGAHVPGQAGVG